MTTYESMKRMREVQREGLRELLQKHLAPAQRINYDPAVNLEQTSRIDYEGKMALTRIRYQRL